jgi:hypothetical protein
MKKQPPLLTRRFPVQLSRLVLALGFLCLVSSGRALVIADWQFNTDATTMLLDSSGNGHTLANTGVTWSADNGGSAVFSGSSILNTVATLDLSSYTQVTVEWSMKTSTAGQGIIFAQANGVGGWYPIAGALGGYVDTGRALVTAQSGPLGGPVSYNMNAAPAGTVPLGTWNNYRLTLDTTDPAATRMKVYLNNVIVGTNSWAGTGSSSALANTTFVMGNYIGAGLGFNGSIDNMKISTGIVPEPSTWALLGIGLTAVSVLRRRSGVSNL